MIETVEIEGTHFALILRSNFRTDGIRFFTPENYSQQLGYMNRPKGYVVQPHYHLEVIREVSKTNEVLFIKTGRIKAKFYNIKNEGVAEAILEKGDVIMLISGGHSFEMLEDSEIIEIKQGPFNGINDKRIFKPT